MYIVGYVIEITRPKHVCPTAVKSKLELREISDRVLFIHFGGKEISEPPRHPCAVTMPWFTSHIWIMSDQEDTNTFILK